jgi:hypothetical protein
MIAETAHLSLQGAADELNRRGLTTAGVRPMIAETAHLSLQGAADELNRRGLTTAGGKQWHAMQVSRARCYLGV